MSDKFEELMEAEISKLKEDIHCDFPKAFAETITNDMEAVENPVKPEKDD